MIMPTLRAVVPGSSLVLATMLAAMPWGLPAQTRFLLPLLPFAVIHFWTLRRPATMPEGLAFACGLALDVLSHGPLGFWSLIYLLGMLAARVVPLPGGAVGTFAPWLHYCVVLAALALAQWLLATAFFVSSVDARPFFVGAILAMSTYPLVSLLLGPLARLWPVDTKGRFERGG